MTTEAVEDIGQQRLVDDLQTQALTSKGKETHNNEKDDVEVSRINNHNSTTHSTETLPDSEVSAAKRRKISDGVSEEHLSTNEETADKKAKEDEKEKKKEEARLLKEKKKEEERVLKEKKKEEERLLKEKKKEEERLLKEKKKEEERLLKEKKKEEERLLKEKKKEEERQEKERKKEEDRIKREKKKEEEKQERERKKEEERLERERKREEDKKKKEEERLERKRKLEEEKERKELEKKRIEERNQKKISSFFTKKVAPEPASTEKPLDQSTTCDFNKEFLPFYVKENVKMATSVSVMSANDIDKLFAGNTIKENNLSESTERRNDTGDLSTSSFLSFFNKFRKPTVLSEITSPQQILDALNSTTAKEAEISELFERVPPLKYLHFYENARPPYVGTWFAPKHRLMLSSPYDTALTGMDYEYDLELEWNNDEEGEDLDEEDMEEEDDAGEDDDIDDFVEGDGNQEKRKVSTLVVTNKLNDGTNDDFFGNFKVAVMVKGITFPIQTPKVQVSAAKESTSVEAASDPTPVVNVLVPQKKTIKDPDVLRGLAEFIKKNNDFSIGTLVELSKKEFADFTKGMLKNTIQDLAEYNKKTLAWELKESEGTSKIPVP